MGRPGALRSRGEDESGVSSLDQQRAPARRRGGAPGGAPGSSPPPGGPPPEGGRGGGFGGFGGRGGGGGGGFFGGGGGNRGRLQLSLTDTITFVDKVRITPGGPELDYLHGDAAGSLGGTPRHNVEAQAGWSNNGLGARLGANWRSATRVTTTTGDDLHFSSLGTFNLRLFAEGRRILPKSKWARGLRVSLDVLNLFNDRQKVRDSNGETPLQYQAAYRDPIGRTVELELRMVF